MSLQLSRSVVVPHSSPLATHSRLLGSDARLLVSARCREALPHHHHHHSRPLLWFILAVAVWVYVVFDITPTVLGVSGASLPECSFGNFSALSLSHHTTVFANCHYKSGSRLYLGTDLASDGTTDVLQNATVIIQNITNLEFRFIGNIQNLTVLIDNITSADEFYYDPSNSSVLLESVSGPRSSFTGCNASNVTVIMSHSNVPRGLSIEVGNITGLTVVVRDALISGRPNHNDVFVEPFRLLYTGRNMTARNVSVVVTNVHYLANAIQTAIVAFGEFCVVEGLDVRMSNVTFDLIPKVINIVAFERASVTNANVRISNVSLLVASALPAGLANLTIPDPSVAALPDFVAMVAFADATVQNMTVDVSGCHAHGPINSFLGTNLSTITGLTFTLSDSVLNFTPKENSTTDLRSGVALQSTAFKSLSITMSNVNISLGNTSDVHFLVSAVGSVVTTSTPSIIGSGARMSLTRVNSDDPYNGGGIVIDSCIMTAVEVVVWESDWNLRNCHVGLLDSQLSGLSFIVAASRWTLVAVPASELGYLFGMRSSTLNDSVVRFTNATELSMTLLRNATDGAGLFVGTNLSLRRVHLLFDAVSVSLNSASIRTTGTGIVVLDNATWDNQGVGGLAVINNSTVKIVSQLLSAFFLTTDTYHAGITINVATSRVNVTASNVSTLPAESSPLATLFSITTRGSVQQLGKAENVSFLVNQSNVTLASELGHLVKVIITISTMLFLNHTAFDNVLFDVVGGSRILSEHTLVFSTPKNWLNHSFRNTTFAVRDRSIATIRGHGTVLVPFAFFASYFGDATNGNRLLVDNATVELFPLVPSTNATFAALGNGGFLCSLALVTPSYSVLVNLSAASATNATNASVPQLDVGHVPLHITNVSTIQLEYMTDDDPSAQPNETLAGLEFGNDPMGGLLFLSNNSGTSTKDAPAGFNVVNLNPTISVRILVDASSLVELVGGRLMCALLADAMNISNAVVSFENQSHLYLRPAISNGTTLIAAAVLIRNSKWVDHVHVQMTSQATATIQIASATFDPLVCIRRCRGNAIGNSNTSGLQPNTTLTLLNTTLTLFLALILTQSASLNNATVLLSENAIVNMSILGVPQNSTTFPTSKLQAGMGILGFTSSSSVANVIVDLSDRATFTGACNDCAAVLVSFATSTVSRLVDLRVHQSAIVNIAAAVTQAQATVKSIEDMLNDANAALAIQGFSAFLFYRVDTIVNANVSLDISTSAYVHVAGGTAAIILGIAGNSGLVNVSAAVQRNSTVAMYSTGTRHGRGAQRLVSKRYLHRPPQPIDLHDLQRQRSADVYSDEKSSIIPRCGCRG